MSTESHIYYNLSGLPISEYEWRTLTADPHNVVLRHSHVFNVCVVSRWTGLDARPDYPALGAVHPLIFDCGVVVKGRTRAIAKTDTPDGALHFHDRFLRKFTWWRTLVFIVSLAIVSFVTGFTMRLLGTDEWMVLGWQVLGVTNLGVQVIKQLQWWAPVGGDA